MCRKDSNDLGDRPASGIWRLAVIAGYVALAVAVGVGSGGRGLAILAFLYLLAGAWAAFILAWNWVFREVSRRHFQRLAG